MVKSLQAEEVMTFDLELDPHWFHLLQQPVPSQRTESAYLSLNATISLLSWDAKDSRFNSVAKYIKFYISSSLYKFTLNYTHWLQEKKRWHGMMWTTFISAWPNIHNKKDLPPKSKWDAFPTTQPAAWPLPLNEAIENCASHISHWQTNL